MKTARFIPGLSLLLLAALVVFWLGQRPDEPPPVVPPGPATSPSTQPFRIGLIPERDIIAQRKRYRALGDYLATKLNRPVHLVTLNTYEAVLEDFRRGEVDAAFLGSLIAVLTMDRLDARVLVKPEMTNGTTTYRGVIFVREDSPIKSVPDLAGKSMMLVRTTTGGNLFPIEQFRDHKLLGRVNTRWAGTHDEAIAAVARGDADAGAVKDLRLDAYEVEHPGQEFRRLAISGPVPNNALVVSRKTMAELGPRLEQIMLQMHEDPSAAAALETNGMRRCVPCSIDEYRVIYDSVERLGPSWADLGIDGPPPRRPATRPASQPAAKT